jgi:hypothetical protein
MKNGNLFKLLPIVNEEVDNVFENLYDSRYYQYLIVSKLRSKIVDRVLEKLENVYDNKPSKLSFCQHKIPYHSLELRLLLENYIYQEIDDLCQSSDCVTLSKSTVIANS